MGLYGASLWSHSLTHDIDSASHSARLRLEQTAGGAAAIRSSLLGQLTGAKSEANARDAARKYARARATALCSLSARGHESGLKL